MGPRPFRIDLRRAQQHVERFVRLSERDQQLATHQQQGRIVGKIRLKSGQQRLGFVVFLLSHQLVGCAEIRPRNHNGTLTES